MVDASFWIRVYDLTLVARNEYIGWLIGNLLGKFEEIDLDNSEVEWREFMCVKVKLDITWPLLGRKKLNIELPKIVRVYFKYEQFLDFCFCCGVLNHGHKDCKKWLATLEAFETVSLPYIKKFYELDLVAGWDPLQNIIPRWGQSEVHLQHLQWSQSSQPNLNPHQLGTQWRC